MKEQAAEIASGKTAMTVGTAAAMTPAWIDFINGETFQAIVSVSGWVLVLSILLVNIVLLPYRFKNAKAEAALKQHQLKEAGLKDE